MKLLPQHMHELGLLLSPLARSKRALVSQDNSHGKRHPFGQLEANGYAQGTNARLESQREVTSATDCCYQSHKMRFRVAVAIFPVLAFPKAAAFDSAAIATSSASSVAQIVSFPVLWAL